ncbi:MAG TPA: TlyA family RNA methyltransferase [Chloroflexota bacterium]|nr:TlyA family RNA methyltransferase [Chloroflexota bacterium]
MSLERIRLDQLLIERGLAAGRGEAQSLILAGLVRAGDQVLSRPGQHLEREIELVVERPAVSYASRGGLKLAAALDRFPVPVAGAVVLDVGASTGGFTDVLLRHDAARVYAVDVGYGQLAWTLRTDPRVIVMDRTNIRHLQQLPDTPSLATIDVSFISLDLVLPAVQRLLAEDGQVVCLIKPQFEVGKGQVGKGGVVRDPAAHAAVLHRVLAHAQEGGWIIRGLIASPITGPAGNREFLAWLQRAGAAEPIDLDRLITGVTRG